MKIRVLIFVSMLAILATPLIALASDISGAQYYATVLVTNNSTATNNVATTANISTDNLIAGNYLNSTANNTVLRNSSGADVEFMPGYTDANLWCFWVPSIGADSYLTYILYTANSTGGEIRYFPAAGGMTTPDNASLELGDNYSIEQKGWVDASSGADKNLADKDSGMGGFKSYISANNTITSEILDRVTPTGHNDPSTSWSNDANAYDDDAEPPVTFADELIPLSSWSGWLEFTHAAITSYAARYYVNCDANINQLQIDINNGGWVNAYDGSFNSNVWESQEFTEQSITGIRFRFYNSDGGAARRARINEIDFGIKISVSATVSSGEYTIRSLADGSYFRIYVNGTESDNTSLGGASVPNNDTNWTFVENGSMLYLESHEIEIGGTQAQYIEWEYDNVFHDQSANSNDATPTFRSASSDPDVSANMTAFLPVAEAQAPDYVLGAAPPFITSTPNITGNFTIVPPTGTFPLAGVITAVANATGTPEQLPLLIIAVFVILAASLSMSAVMRRHGSGTLIVKIIAVTACCGIFIALQNFGIDLWMLVVFLVISVALAMGSRQLGWS